MAVLREKKSGMCIYIYIFCLYLFIYLGNNSSVRVALRSRSRETPARLSGADMNTLTREPDVRYHFFFSLILLALVSRYLERYLTTIRPYRSSQISPPMLLITPTVYTPCTPSCRRRVLPLRALPR